MMLDVVRRCSASRVGVRPTSRRSKCASSERIMAETAGAVRGVHGQVLHGRLTRKQHEERRDCGKQLECVQ